MEFSKIKKGEMVSTTMYMEIVNVDPKKEAITVKDNLGRTFDIVGKPLIEQGMCSNTQFSKTEIITKTALAERLVNAGDKIFKVTYTKQDGTERELTGRLLNTENHMGRSNVTDLEITSENNLRQVDHRTISCLILNNVCSKLKK